MATESLIRSISTWERFMNATPPKTSEKPGEVAASRPVATSFEDQVAEALKGIRAGHTPAEIRSRMLAAGVEPLTADTAYRTARRRMFESNRRLGARFASIAIGVLCGATLIFVPLGWTIALGVALVGGLLLMGVATLVWLTGLGADEA